MLPWFSHTRSPPQVSVFQEGKVVLQASQGRRHLPHPPLHFQLFLSVFTLKVIFDKRYLPLFKFEISGLLFSWVFLQSLERSVRHDFISAMAKLLATLLLMVSRLLLTFLLLLHPYDVAPYNVPVTSDAAVDPALVDVVAAVP